MVMKFLAAVWALVVFVAVPAAAQTVAILPNAMTQFVDGNGAPYTGGKVFMYVPFTTTPKATYQDPLGHTPNSNPITLDANGRAVVWGTGEYRQILQDLNGVVVWDQLTYASSVNPGAAGTTIWYGTAAGTANAIALNVPAGFVGIDGQAIAFIASATNTGTTTINASGFGSVLVEKNTVTGLAVLTGGEVTIGGLFYATYSATNHAFILQDPTPNASRGVNVQTGNYVVQPSDCGGVVQSGTGVTGQLTVTFPAVGSTFPTGCVVSLVNGDSKRLKVIVGVNGISWLYPVQYAGTVQVQISGTTWVAANAPVRYRPDYNPTYNVDVVSGSDANDCFGSGAGACATLVGAFFQACNTLDSGGYYPTVQMTPGQTFKGSFTLTVGDNGGPGGGGNDLGHTPTCVGFRGATLDLNGAVIAAINQTAIYIHDFPIYLKVINSAGYGNGGLITTGAYGSTKGFLVTTFGGVASYEFGDGNVIYGDVPVPFSQLASTRNSFLWTEPNACPNVTTTVGCENSIQVNLNQGNFCTGVTAHSVVVAGVVTSVVVDAGGSGCMAPPYILFVGSCSVMPTANATLSGTSVTAITVTTPGSGCAGLIRVQIGNSGTSAFESLLKGFIEIEAPVVATGEPVYTLGFVQSVQNSLVTFAFKNPLIGTVHGPQWNVSSGGVITTQGQAGTRTLCPANTCNSYLAGDAVGWVGVGGGSMDNPGTPFVSTGVITTFGAITAGAGGTDGTYASVPLTGGSGQGAVANVTVAGGVVTAVSVAGFGTSTGWNYAAADVLSAATQNIGNVTGFSIPVTAVTAAGCGAGATISSGSTDYEGFVVLGTAPTATCTLQNTSLTQLICTGSTNPAENVEVTSIPASGIGSGQAPGKMVLGIGGVPFAGEAVRWVCHPAQTSQ